MKPNRYATRSHVVEAIIKAIEENGPLTSAQICDELDKHRNLIASVISRMRKDQPTQPQRLYVIRWTREDDNARAYLRAVYALGTEPDAKKPKRKSKVAASRDSRAKRRRKVNSVFQLGIPLKERVQYERSVRNASGRQSLQTNEDSAN